MDNFEDYAAQMQKMYADAFAAAETMKESAMADRNTAAKEMEKARDIRKAAEQNGEKIALEYFASRHKTIIDQARKETLSALVVRHLKEGKEDEEIMNWLEVDEDFMNHCKIIVKKEKEITDRPHIEYSQSGRGGTLSYVAGDKKIDFDWEFAGGNGVAIIFIPEEKYWLAHTGIPLSQRQSILEFIAKEIIDDKAPDCVYSITDNCIEILYRR
ncbi:MAG: hypothetical protein ABUT20_58170 [Bacteroidota bacterium]